MHQREKRCDACVFWDRDRQRLRRGTDTYVAPCRRHPPSVFDGKSFVHVTTEGNQSCWGDFEELRYVPPIPKDGG